MSLTGGFCWHPEGRIIYTCQEPPPNSQNSNLWELRANPQTGQSSGSPRKITHWSGTAIWSVSASAVDRSGIRAIFCTSGGKGLYLSASPQPGISELSYSDLTGQVRVLWQLKGDFGRGLSPSPDGRYPAMAGIMTTSDAWLLENF